MYEDESENSNYQSPPFKAPRSGGNYERQFDDNMSRANERNNRSSRGVGI